MKPWKDYLRKEITIDDFVHNLKNYQRDYMIDPMRYSRYGDGEFSAIFGIDGENCDGHKYHPSLGKELEMSLRKQISFGNQFYYGLVPIAVKVFGDRIQDHLNNMFSYDGLSPRWVSGNILMEANREGKLKQFLDLCKSKFYVLYVGPKRLREGLEKDNFLPIYKWVEVPETNAWEEYENIKRELFYQFMKSPCSMIGFSAGMMSKILIMDLAYCKSRDIGPIIDFGSMWDGYYGFNSRKYHHDYDWDVVREKNLNG